MDELFKVKQETPKFDALVYGERRMNEAIRNLIEHPSSANANEVRRWAGYTRGAGEALPFTCLKWNVEKIKKFHEQELDEAFTEAAKTDDWGHYHFQQGLVEGFNAKMEENQ